MKIAGFLLLILLMAQGCKDQAKTSGQSEAIIEEVVEKNQRQAEFTPVEEADVDTLEDGTILRKASGMAPLLMGIWHYDGILDMSAEEPQQRGNGRWLQFHQDNTFTEGQWNEPKKYGRWSVLSDEGILEMIYDDDLARLKGFKVQTNGDDMILVGVGRYATNGIQMKLVRHDGFPEKGNSQ